MDVVGLDGCEALLPKAGGRQGVDPLCDAQHVVETCVEDLQTGLEFAEEGRQPHLPEIIGFD